jgi:ligand-binding sensor domain-containing protein
MSKRSKSLRLALFVSFLFLFSSHELLSQNSQWVNYTYHENIESIVGKGDTLWLATSGGLVKFNTKTEEKVYYNVSNSELISNHLSPLAIDSLGNVWMWKHFSRALCFPSKSTDYLVKFDGKSWSYFSPELDICETWGLSPRIMEVDNNNGIWIGTYRSGLIHFDGNNWIIYDTTNSNIPSNNIVALDIDKENRIWMGSSEVNGLLMFEQFEWNIFNSTNSMCPDEPVINLKVDGEDNKWLTTRNKVIKYDGNLWTIENPQIPENTFIQQNSIQIDSNNELWLFHSELYHLSENRWEKYSPISHREFVHCSAFFIDKYNNKWLNSDKRGEDNYPDFFKGGLTKFDDSNWNVFEISGCIFKGYGVGTIFKDSKNNIWLDSDILSKVKDDLWTYYYPKYEMQPVRGITSIKEDLYGNIWLGSYGDGLIKIDGSDWEYYNETNSNIPNNNIWDIAFDKDGNLWFTCSYEIGVVKFDGSNFTVYDSTNSGLPENYVVDIENDSKGDLYFGTGSKGLVKYDLDSWTIYDTQIKWNSIYSLYVDKEDAVWIGGFGITKFTDGIWTYYQHDDSLDYYYNVITEIDKDANNNLWAIARYGLYKFDGNQWHKFDHTNSGLPDEFLNDIEFDQYGNLWVGTSSGVILFNEKGVVSNIKYNQNEAVNFSYQLFQNYPNPFNPMTTIKYNIPPEVNSELPAPTQSGSIVNIAVYDILGREIAILVNEKQKPGNYEIMWNPSGDGLSLSSGVYFYRLTCDKYSETKKLILVR